MNKVFANAQRAQYGQSSEKKTYVLNEDQLNFFNEAEDCQDHKAEEPTEETLAVKAHARKKKRAIDELSKNLPVEERVIDLPESRLSCDKGGGTFKLIGKKLIRRELIIIPQSEKILEYYSCTYACDRCKKDAGFAYIITTKAPPPLMKHSLASPSSVADVMSKKSVQCTQSLLKPLYKHMKQQLMAFLDYGDVPISNNLAENAIRPFVVEKNWLFCDSVKGAESSAIVYSLVETAKANGIEPYEHLMLVLSMLPYLGKSQAHKELEKLMPWHSAVRHWENIRK